MGSGAGKPVVSPAATPAYTFCYNGAAGPSTSTAANTSTSRRASEAGEGAGVGVGVQTADSSSRSQSRLSDYGEDVDENCNMVCEACSASFHVFKRKYRCTDCDKYYCSNCFIKEPRKCCSTCSAISLRPTRADLMTLKIKDLRLYLNTHSVSTQACTEKDDLVDLVLQYVQVHPYPPTRSNTTRETRSSSSSSASSNRSSARPTGQGQRASHPQPQMSQQQNAGQRTTQRFEEMFNDIFSRFANPTTESSVDPPGFNAFFTSGTGVPTRDDPFNSTSAASGSNQRPQSRTAWTSQGGQAGQTGEGGQTAPGMVNQPATTDPQTTPEAEQTPVQPIRRRGSLSEITQAGGIESLSVKQLKEILTANFVNYKGCVERWELQERVKRLYDERQERKKKEEKLKDTEVEKEGEEIAMDEDETQLCKICMDAVIDCVLLECGHMVTCTNCGKRMNECPICRQYVVRAVHIFRA